MNRIQQSLRYLLKAMCSEYNGIQVFLYPGTLFYWLSGSGLLDSFSSLMSMRMHFLPLVFFTVLLAYVAFMVLKIYTTIFDGPHRIYPKRLSDFWDHVINLHLYLFLTVIVLMVFFVLSKFVSYYYGIDLPLRQGVWLFFRAFTILLILFYYIRSMWIRPFKQREFSLRRSERHCLAWMSRHFWAAMKYTAVILLLVLVAIRLYLIVIVVIISPVLSVLGSLIGQKLIIELIPVFSMGSIFYNVFMLFAAFMLSNLFFYPIIKLGQSLLMAMHPISIKQVNHAKSEK
ncbi:MAG: hypothetical protein WCQ73_00425 [Candidatus Cloacimonadaceae bacterium]|nr:hypothetical protein [Candidatus Cloacimonadota bacterium]